MTWRSVNDVEAWADSVSDWTAIAAAVQWVPGGGVWRVIAKCWVAGVAIPKAVIRAAIVEAEVESLRRSEDSSAMMAWSWVLEAMAGRERVSDCVVLAASYADDAGVTFERMQVYARQAEGMYPSVCWRWAQRGREVLASILA